MVIDFFLFTLFREFQIWRIFFVFLITRRYVGRQVVGTRRARRVYRKRRSRLINRRTGGPAQTPRTHASGTARSQGLRP